MADLELTRMQGDRRAYALEGIGRLRLEGVLARAATAQADGASWRFFRTGFWRRSIAATDAGGSVVGAFEPRGLRRGGTVRWRDHELALRAGKQLARALRAGRRRSRGRLARRQGLG